MPPPPHPVKGSALRYVRTPRVVALAATLSGVLAVTMLGIAGASSHREAPLIAEDPVADNTDVYAFVSPESPDTTTLISNWIPFEEPAGGPNFYAFGDDVLYTINIDNDGDAVEDITYEFQFRTLDRTEPFTPGDFLYNTSTIDSIDDTDWKLPQFYTVTRVDDDGRKVLAEDVPTPPVNIGPRSTPNYAELADAAIRGLHGGGQVFAGQRDEIFAADLGSIFDLGGLRPLNPAHVIPLEEEPGVDTLSGYNVHTIALQVPTDQLTHGDEPVIGVWSDTYRRKVRVFQGHDGARLKHKGPWVQVSRLGNPLVNEVMVPYSLKDVFNASDPSGDAQFLPAVRKPTIDNLLVSLYPQPFENGCTPDIDGVRKDLVTVFLKGIPGLNRPAHVTPSEQLRLNTAIAPVSFDEAAPLGVLAGDNAGFPNGRRPVDDVTDIALQAIGGNLPPSIGGDCFQQSPGADLTDGVSVNQGETDERPISGTFPYLPIPHQGYDHIHDHTNTNAKTDE